MSDALPSPVSVPNPASTGDAAPMAPLCSVFRRYLRSVGQKYTTERAEVLDAIIRHDGVFEAEELLAMMRGRGLRVSKATVYRTIRLLQACGIITQTLFDANQAHYQLVYGRAPRDYIICMHTGRYIEFTDAEVVALRDRICRGYGWTPAGHRLLIYGVSPEAQAADASGIN